MSSWQSNVVRNLSSFEKYKTNIDDIGGKRRYGRNILQWCKNEFKSKNNTNGDYWDVFSRNYPSHNLCKVDQIMASVFYIFLTFFETLYVTRIQFFHFSGRNSKQSSFTYYKDPRTVLWSSKHNAYLSLYSLYSFQMTLPFVSYPTQDAINCHDKIFISYSSQK